MTPEEHLAKARAITRKYFGIDLHEHPKLFETLICKIVGYTPYPDHRDGEGPNGELLEVKLCTTPRTQNGGKIHYFVWGKCGRSPRTGNGQAKRADVFVLVGWYEGKYQFFVYPGYMLNNKTTFTTPVKRYDSLYRKTLRKLDVHKVALGDLREAVGRAVEYHLEHKQQAVLPLETT